MSVYTLALSLNKQNLSTADISLFVGKTTGCSLLELGCGTGIVGITAALLGFVVTLTDVWTLRKQVGENIAANKLTSNQAEFLEFDWHNISNSNAQKIAKRSWNMVVLADPVYSLLQISYFKDALHLVLDKNPHCSVLLAHCDRSDRVTSAMFTIFAELGRKGQIVATSETDKRVQVFHFPPICKDCCSGWILTQGDFLIDKHFTVDNRCSVVYYSTVACLSGMACQEFKVNLINLYCECQQRSPCFTSECCSKLGPSLS